jgi:hypothetical protein
VSKGARILLFSTIDSQHVSDNDELSEIPSFD